MTIEPDLLRHVAAAYEDTGVVGMTGVVEEPDPRRFGSKQAGIRGLLFRGAEGTFTRFGYPRYLLDLATPRDIEVMQGCFMSARADVAREVGFDESLPLTASPRTRTSRCGSRATAASASCPRRSSSIARRAS